MNDSINQKISDEIELLLSDWQKGDCGINDVLDCLSKIEQIESKLTSQGDIYSQILKLQQKITRIKKVGVNPHFQSKYTPLDEIIGTLRPVMVELGLILIQEVAPIINSEGGQTLSIKTIIRHVTSGTELVAHGYFKVVDPNPQKLGSLITYLRRYQLEPLLGIVASEDDDGNHASEHVKEQASNKDQILFAYDVSEVLDDPEKSEALINYMQQIDTDAKKQGYAFSFKLSDGIVLSHIEIKKLSKYALSLDEAHKRTDAMNES